MRINKINNKLTIGTVGLLTLALLLATGISYTYRLWPFNTHQTEAEVQEAANASDATNPQQKKNIPSQKEIEASGGDKTTDEIPVAATGSLEITTLEQRNDTVVYAGAIQNIATNGICSALFEHANSAARPVTHTSSATNGTCPEVSISQVEFGARGEWKLTLRYYVDDEQLVTTKIFEVQ